MKQISWFSVALLLLLLTAIAACCWCCCMPPKSMKDIMDSEPPPATFQETDLVGTWEGHYGGYAGYGQGLDRLILRADGTFKQIYKIEKQGYVYETPWNKWWVERFPDGRVRVHLEGARYYVDGIEMAERDGLHATSSGPPWPYSFYDWFVEGQEKWSVEMVGKLVLNVRQVSSGEIVLAHMSSSWESRTWKMLVGVSTDETPSPVQTPAP
jgi:hypothetical protein